ncbi:MAG: DUF502 domain-containing protein [Candidatus Omnitrophica bacterium]|nr:DUF502 domain-containing protein [Candidatus Omnitrophota bacterium]
MFKKLRNGFFTGMALLLPIVLTIVVTKWVVVKLNSLILAPIIAFLHPLLPGLEFNYLLILIKGFLFFLVILLIALLGLAANNLTFRRFFSHWERLLFRIPFISKVYITVKQISNAFLGEKRHIFQRVVLIEYPRKELYSIGFVTSLTQRKIWEKIENFTSFQGSVNILNIFIPTTPNPTSGFLLLVPEKDTIPLDISVEEGMKLVISGGVVFR